MSKNLWIARIGLAALGLASAALRVVDWANRRSTPSAPAASMTDSEVQPEDPVNAQRRFEDSRAVMSEFDTHVLPHFGVMHYASCGITEEGHLFLRETMLMKTETEFMPIIVTHAIRNDEITESKVRIL